MAAKKKPKGKTPKKAPASKKVPPKQKRGGTSTPPQ